MISISRSIGKLCAALLLCIVLTAFVQHDYTSRRQMSREEFLEKESARYDRQINRPSPFALTFVVSGFVVFVTVGVYELIAFGVSQATKKLDGPDPAG